MHTLFYRQRERERGDRERKRAGERERRERERKRAGERESKKEGEREKKCNFYLFLKGMTGALTPFSYLVIRVLD